MRVVGALKPTTLVAALCLVATLAAARDAVAAGPWLWTVNGEPGIAATPSAGPEADARYVARLAGSATRLVATPSTDDVGVGERALTIDGRWGFQAATSQGQLVGLSPNGRVLVLTGPTRTEASSRSRFVVVSTPGLTRSETIDVAGDMTIDALSPDGRRLFLIQHLQRGGVSRYRVRAYDLRAHRLLPGVIADKRQQGWLMQGYPLDRVESAGGRFVYTLYQPNANYPFIHALDTVKGTAVCIGLPIPWSDPEIMQDARLELDPSGRTLTVGGSHLAKQLTIDLRSGRLRER